MIKNVLGCTTLVFAIASVCLGQGTSFIHDIPSDPNFRVFGYDLNIPTGQTFIKKSTAEGMSRLRTYSPKNHSKNMISSDTAGDRIYTHVSPASCSSRNSTVTHATTMRGVEIHHEFEMDHIGSATESNKFIWELNPDPKQAMDLKMNLGIGSARLDLSDLSVESLQLFSGASDIYVSYDQPNRTQMELMELEGGMSKIVLRNVEYAHAKKVKVLNGMGDTKIVIGDKTSELHRPSNISVEAGAGSCLILVHENAPVKVVISDNLFSTVEVDEYYQKAGDETYLSPSFKLNPQNSITIYVDLGVGSFDLITFSK